MRADRRLVVEVLRFLEIADGCDNLSQRVGLRGCLPPGPPVALRRLVHTKVRFGAEVEHQIEVLASCLFVALAAEVDRANRTAGSDALAMILATIQIYLIGPVDRLLGTGFDAGVATRADLEVDRIVLRPARLKRTEPAIDALELARIDRVIALLRQFGRCAAAGDQDGDGESDPEAASPRQVPAQRDRRLAADPRI